MHIWPHREKDTAPSLESATPQLVRLVNIEPLSSLSADQVKQIEAEIMNLTKSMPKCRDGSMRAVLLCRRGALLRKVSKLTLFVVSLHCVYIHVHVPLDSHRGN